MAKKEKSLPKPPKTPFGRSGSFESSDEETPLLADRMAHAAAQGKLDSFLKEELKDNEHAQKLAMIMMGMTGITPPGSSSVSASKERYNQKDNQETGSPDPSIAAGMSDEIMNAAQEGDVQQLVELLKKEHKRMSSKEASKEEKKKQGEPDAKEIASEQALAEKIHDIAAENSVSPDWIMVRALKLYISEYEKTGRL